MSMGFLHDSVLKHPPATQETQETQVPSSCWEDPLEEEMATHSNILAGEFHRQWSQEGYSPWDHRELDTTEHTRICMPMS